MAGHIGDMVSQEWNTPAHIVTAVKDTFGYIGLDPCDNEYSCTGAIASYKLPEKDGLAEPWHLYGPVFCNPPYGRTILSPGLKVVDPKVFKTLPEEERVKHKISTIADWVRKAHVTHSTDETEVILLIPAATETTFWHDHIWCNATRVCFLKGRVNHPLEGKLVAPSTKPSAVVYYGRCVANFRSAFESLGRVVEP